MPTTDDTETPWTPLSMHERVCFALIKAVLFVFRADFFDMYRRQDVKYDDMDEMYRIGMGPISDLKDEWLEVYQIQSEFYDDNDSDDWVSYCMWLVMRSDDTINPPTIIHGERNDDGSWDVSTNEKPPEIKKQEKKREILYDIDETGFIDPVLPESDEVERQIAD